MTSRKFVAESKSLVFLAQFGPLHEMQDTASLDDSLVSAGFPLGFPPPFGGGSWGVGVGRCQVVWTERRHAPGLSSWQLGAENGSRKALGFKSVEELDASKVWAIAYVSDPRLIQPLKLHKKPDQDGEAGLSRGFPVGLPAGFPPGFPAFPLRPHAQSGCVEATRYPF